MTVNVVDTLLEYPAMASTKLITANGRVLMKRCRPSCQFRHFSNSTRCMVNPLLNLSHFSAAKEAQFLSKERKIPREEFHPHLQLIRSSEVDPFAPVPGASRSVIAALEEAKAGKADAETTYTLALSNMMSQIQLSRRETMEVTSALMRIQEKHKREERNALLFMLTAVTLLSFIMVKTRALEDLKDYAFGVRNEVRDSEKKWLGAPPAYATDFQRSKVAQMSSLDREPSSSHMPSVRKPLADVKPSKLAPTDTSSPSPPQEAGWTFSRLFWASPGRK